MWVCIIQELLESKQLTLETIAEEIGVKAQTIFRLFNGDTQYPVQKTGLRLLVLHMKFCPDKYGQTQLVKTKKLITWKKPEALAVRHAL